MPNEKKKPDDKSVEGDEEGKVSNCQEELETAYLEDGTSIQNNDDEEPTQNSGEIDESVVNPKRRRDFEAKKTEDGNQIAKKRNTNDASSSRKNNVGVKGNPGIKDDPINNGSEGMKDDSSQEGGQGIKDDQCNIDATGMKDGPSQKDSSGQKKNPSNKNNPGMKNNPGINEGPSSKDNPGIKEGPSGKDNPGIKDGPSKDVPGIKDGPSTDIPGSKDGARKKRGPRSKDDPNKDIPAKEKDPFGRGPATSSKIGTCEKKGCRKKLKLTSYSCRCGKFFCGIHMTDHDCTFDYHKEAQDQIEEDNPKIVAEKIRKI